MDSSHRPNIPHDEWMDLQRMQDDPINKNRIDVLVVSSSIEAIYQTMRASMIAAPATTTSKPRACGGYSTHDCVALLGGAG